MSEIDEHVKSAFTPPVHETNTYLGLPSLRLWPMSVTSASKRVLCRQPRGLCSNPDLNDYTSCNATEHNSSWARAIVVLPLLYHLNASYVDWQRRAVREGLSQLTNAPRISALEIKDSRISWKAYEEDMRRHTSHSSDSVSPTSNQKELMLLLSSTLQAHTSVKSRDVRDQTLSNDSETENCDPREGSTQEIEEFRPELSQMSPDKLNNEGSIVSLDSDEARHAGLTSHDIHDHRCECHWRLSNENFLETVKVFTAKLQGFAVTAIQLL